MIVPAMAVLDGDVSHMASLHTRRMQSAVERRSAAARMAAHMSGVQSTSAAAGSVDSCPISKQGVRWVVSWGPWVAHTPMLYDCPAAYST